jgi:hypothetical protein
MSGYGKTNFGEDRLMDVVAHCLTAMIKVEVGS